MPETVNIRVGGNVDGSIVVGDANFVVNTNYGSIVYQQARPQARPRGLAPQAPRPARFFVNRSAELEQISDWISKNEVILIHAADGLGKSALLRQAGNLAAARAMPGGVVFLDNLDAQGAAWGAGDVVQKIFDALFESEPPLKVDMVSARTYLSNTRPLVLLDEIPLSPALQRALPDLLPQGALILAADVPVGADYQRQKLGPLPREEAFQLLASRLDGVLTEAQRPVAAALCALLQDIPLALSITGSLIRYGGLSLEEATNTLSVMPAEIADPIPRVLDMVYRLAFSRLSPAEKKVLAVAAQTPGVSVSVEWLSAALGENVDQALERLKTMGLLFANSPRLRLPPGFLLPARRTSVLDEDTVLGRLVDYLLAGASSGAGFIGDEAGNLFGALLWASRTGHPREVIALGRALDAQVSLQGLWERWGGMLELVLEAARQAKDRAAEAWAVHQLGVREIGTGSRERALDLLRQALQIRRTLGDEVGMAFTQHNIDFLLGLPLPPREGESRPQPPRPSGGLRSSRPLLFGLGLAAIVIAAIIFALLPGWRPAGPQKPEIASRTPRRFASATATATRRVAATRTPTPFQLRPSRVTLTPAAAPPFVPEATPLGGSGWIVFQNASTNDPAKLEPWSIHSLGFDGYDLANLTFGALFSIREPAWSPDGRQLAFTSNNDTFYSDIFAAEVDGSNRRLITLDLQERLSGHKSHATWSPDGQRIAFLLSNDSGSDIFVVDADGKGSNLTNLTNSPDQTGRFDYPEWSPDGERIAYHAFVDRNWEIFVMDADGSNQMQLTRGDGRGQWSIQPTWSPEGKQIAFASNRSGAWEIFVMDRAGGDVRMLTRDDDYDVMPDWSPDGQMLAFSSDRFGSLQIFLMKLDSLEITQGSKMETGSYEVDWRPVPGP